MQGGILQQTHLGFLCGVSVWVFGHGILQIIHHHPSRVNVFNLLYFNLEKQVASILQKPHLVSFGSIWFYVVSVCLDVWALHFIDHPSNVIKCQCVQFKEVYKQGWHLIVNVCGFYVVTFFWMFGHGIFQTIDRGHVMEISSAICGCSQTSCGEGKQAWTPCTCVEQRKSEHAAGL